MFEMEQADNILTTVGFLIAHVYFENIDFNSYLKRFQIQQVILSRF